MLRRTAFSAFVVVAGFGLLIAGCASQDGGAASGSSSSGATSAQTDAGGASATPTESAYAPVQAIFTQHCVACHGDTNPKAGASLTSYDNVMKAGIVKAGDPEGSLVIHALKGTNGAKQMPFKQAPLSDADIQTISDWIKNGAKA